jgi:hypothetical protein
MLPWCWYILFSNFFFHFSYYLFLVPTQPSKPTVSSIVEKSNVNVPPSIGPQTNTSSTVPKVPIFGVSPPRPTKPVTGPIWKCPSCTLEHPAQTASCSLCHGINPDYKRLSG